jgi:dihydroneopterin aldolase
VEVRVTVRDRWEARLAWQCGVQQIDLRTVSQGHSGTPDLDAIRAVAVSVPDLPSCVTLCEDLGSTAATTLAVVGAASGGATHIVVDVSFALTPAAAVRRLSAAAGVGADVGVTVAGRFCVDAPTIVRRLPSVLREAPDIGAAAGCAGIVLDTARKDGRSITAVCPLAHVADAVRRCHERELTCVVGGGLGFGELQGLRGANVDAVAMRSVVTTGARRISRLDPGMLCLAVAHAAGAPLFLG